MSAVVIAPGEIKFEQRPIPKPGPKEVLVKMQGCGLCASNIPLWEGREWFSYPRSAGEPGHEGWGIVMDKGERISQYKLGDRVALLYGKAFAEYVVVNQEVLIKLPVELDDMPFPGEALGCIMNILDRSHIVAGETVAVLGLGFIGMGLVQMLANHGVNIIAVSRREEALHQVEDLVRHQIKSVGKMQVISEINEITDGRGCERIIECTGHQIGLDIGTDSIAEYGKLIIAGYHQDGLRKVDMQKWNWKAIDIINAHERNPIRYREGIEAAIEASRSGLLQPEKLLTHSYPFDKLAEAMDNLAAGNPDMVKSYILF